MVNTVYSHLTITIYLLLIISECLLTYKVELYLLKNLSDSYVTLCVDVGCVVCKTTNLPEGR